MWRPGKAPGPSSFRARVAVLKSGIRRLGPAASRHPARRVALAGPRAAARGLASGRSFPALPARMLDDRVRAGERQGGVTVIESHQAVRLPARSSDLDDLACPLRLSHDAGAHVEPVPD